MEAEKIKKEIFEKVKEFYRLKHIKKFLPGKSKIHYAGRVYDEKEIIAMVDSVLDFWLTMGEYGEKFEQQFSKCLSVKHAILTNSGSSANLLAVSSLFSQQIDGRLNKGDEVITPACTFPTTLNPIIQNGLRPVFVDVELGTYNINVGQLKEALTERTKLIMIPHTLGNPCEMDAIMKIAKEHNLYVIEDTCDALGSKYDGKSLGTFGNVGTFSFYPAHHITLGEGGALITNDDNLARIVTSLRDWGRACFCKWNEKNPEGACHKRFDFKLEEVSYDHRYIYDNIGYNLKLLDIQPAMGLEQLKKLPSFIKTRKKNFQKLYQIFSQYKDFFILPQILEKSDPSWFGFPITLKENTPFNRRDMLVWLEKNNIQTRLLFAGNITRQSAYKNIDYRIHRALKNSDIVMENSFFLGVYPGLTDEMMEYTTNKIEEFMQKFC